MEFTWTQVDEAMPRWRLDQDPGIEIEQWGLGAWSCYVDGKRFSNQAGYRAEVEQLAQQAYATRQAAHEGPGHADVTLSLSSPAPGGLLFRSWTICECSPLLARLGPLLGEPERESLHTEATVREVAGRVMDVPGIVHNLGDET